MKRLTSGDQQSIVAWSGQSCDPVSAPSHATAVRTHARGVGGGWWSLDLERRCSVRFRYPLLFSCLTHLHICTSAATAPLLRCRCILGSHVARLDKGANGIRTNDLLATFPLDRR